MPLMCRAARPIVWISERSERRKPSLSASRIATSDTSGMSSPSRSRLMPTSTSNSPEAQVADDLDPLDRVDVRVQIAHLDAVLVEVVGEVLGHPLGQRRHQHALAASRRAALISESRSSTCVCAGPHLEHRIDEPRRPHDLLDHLPGVRAARSRPAWPRRRSSAAAAARTRRSAAAGCRAPTAAGSRS